MIDLHLHTIASDGILTPRQLVTRAKEAGLKAIAVTDHDNLASISQAEKEGKKKGIEVVPGIEFTTYWTEKNKREFHLLGYFIDYHHPLLIKTVAYYQKVRRRRAMKMLQKLEKLGFVINYDYLDKIASGSIGRPHVSRVVLDNPANRSLLFSKFGRLVDFSDFIQTYLLPGGAAYVEKEGMSPEEAIVLIKKAGGVVVLAHPGYSLKRGEEEMVKKFVAWGIEGLEAISLAGDKAETLASIEYYSRIAAKYHLLITGGSDFHFPGKPEAGLGLKGWNLEIPDSLLEKLKAKAKGLSKK